MPDPPIVSPITAPQPPQPPIVPRAPIAPSPPIDSPTNLARKLAADLNDGKRDEVLKTIGTLSSPNLDALDKALIPALSKDKNKKWGIDLRRFIRFARNPPAKSSQNPPINDQPDPQALKVETKVAQGTVILRTGVKVTSAGGNSTEAYALYYKGPDAAEMNWLQFIWRLVVAEFPPIVKGGKPRRIAAKMRINSKAGFPFHLTIDEAKPRWTIDSTRAVTPFYDFVTRKPDELILFDFPSALPKSGMAADYFEKLLSPTGERLTGKPDAVVAHFVAATYLVQGVDVRYRADIHLKWKFTDKTQPAVEVSGAKGARVSEIQSEHRACLAVQFPGFDFLPGPLIGRPLPADEFDLITDLASQNWAAKKDMERCEDVVALGHAEFIDSVAESPASAITGIIQKADAKSGLNFFGKFGVEGETGFVDEKNAYRSAELPVDRNAALPRVAIILGGPAFVFGTPRLKDYSLATVRHEMMHATHCELAIGWLLQWRDEFTDQPFGDWLAQKKKNGEISDLDFALVSSGISKPLDRIATETLAWTEGFVTGLPFLPAAPNFSLLTPDTIWPGSLGELSGAGKWYSSNAANPAGSSALNRIRGVVCNTLTQSQRDALIKWIDVLLDPGSLHPTDADKKTVSIINSAFSGLKGFLKEVRAKATAPCPK